MCDLKGRFLYEARPDVIPQGWCTDLEIALWGLHYEQREKSRPRRAR